MKKVLFSVLAMVFASQVYGQEGLHIGFFGGPQNTWIFNNEDPMEGRTAFEYQTTWGWNAMAKIGYNIGDPFGFHLGVILSKQGQNHTSVDSATGTRDLFQRELTYIKIPFYIHINSDPGPVMFALELGPQLGLLQDAYYYPVDPLSSLVGSPQLFKPNDFAFAWSLGAEFALTDWFHLVLTHRGDYSLFDMEEKSQPIYANNRGPAHNATFSIQAGLVFCISPGVGGRSSNFWIR